MLSMATIYAGGKPITGLNLKQFDLLSFALRYPGYHDIGVNTATVLQLERKSLVKVNKARTQYKFEDTRG